MINLLIGQEVVLGWNAAKWAGDTILSGSTIRVEATGNDWVVFRDSFGVAHAATFTTQYDADMFMQEVVIL